MAQNDKAVVTAAVGYVFVGPVGTARPAPADLDTLDPVTYGSQVNEVKLSSGTASGGTYTITVGADTTDDIAYNASAATVQAALEALDSVGSGNVVVTGSSLTSPGFTVKFVGALQGKTVTVSVDDTDLTGSTPNLVTNVTTATIGWKPLGHTSRNDMPEFGFDGGDSEVRGTWQKEKLREVITTQAADFLTLFLQQFDTDSFELYYGSDASATAGVFGVSGSAVTTERAFLVIIVDGDAKIAFYAPKASVKRDDSIDMPVDDFASLPIKATFLNHGTANLFEWVSPNFT